MLLRSGRFDEGATQVKRMLSRDRQQLSGLDKKSAEQPFKSEFDEAPAGQPSTSATPDNGSASPSSGSNSQPSPKPRAFGRCLPVPLQSCAPELLPWLKTLLHCTTATHIPLVSLAWPDPWHKVPPGLTLACLCGNMQSIWTCSSWVAHRTPN